MKRLFLFLCISSLLTAAHDTIYLSVSANEFTNPSHPARDGICKPFYYLAQAAQALGYKVKSMGSFKRKSCAGCFFINPPAFEIFKKMKAPAEKTVLTVWEPPLWSTAFYGDFNPYIILHLADHAVNNTNSFKFFYPQPSLKIEESIPSFEEKKLCTMICGYKMLGGAGELYSARRNIITFFEQQLKHGSSDFEFYGEGGWPSSYITFKGSVAHKRPVLKQYKFCVCYENCNNVPGYITEKIFDCLVSGCVPIYWGAPNITDYVPETCFIDRRKFSSNQDLYEFIKAMSQEEYELYIENIKSYLQGHIAYLFSTDYFIDNVLSHMLGQYNKNIIFSQEQQAMLKKARAYYESIARRSHR